MVQIVSFSAKGGLTGSIYIDWNIDQWPSLPTDQISIKDSSCDVNETLTRNLLLTILSFSVNYTKNSHRNIEN